MKKKNVFNSLADIIFRRREPTKELTQLRMLSSNENFIMSQGAELFESDIVVAAIKPYVDQIGKLNAKHVRNDEEFPDARIRFMLTDEPNEFMTFQNVIERVIWDYFIEGDAWIHIDFDDYGQPLRLNHLQPIAIEAQKDSNNMLYMKFHFGNGTSRVIPYSSLIHIKRINGKHDIFGGSPAPLLKELMEVIDTSDRSIKQAVINSAVIRWIVKFTASMRPEDIDAKVKELEDKFLSLDGSGVVGQDAKYDIVQAENKGQIYVPEDGVQNAMKRRVYDFFGINDAIVNGSYTEDEFQAWFDSKCAPIVKQLTEQFTRKLFTQRERGHGNKIIFEGENLLFTSTKTKLELLGVVDRGGMSINEYREILGLSPLERDFFLLRREYGSLGEVAGGDTVMQDEHGNVIQYDRARVEGEEGD